MKNYNMNQIEGRNNVIEAIKSGREIEKIFIRNNDKKGSVLKLIGMAKENKINIMYVNNFKLDELSKTQNHQGVIAFAAAYEYSKLEDIIRKDEKKGFILILDGIMDPHNLGSIIRSANASGVDGIIIPKHRSVGLTETVSKVSQGAIEHVPIVKVTNIAKIVDLLKKKNYWIYGGDGNSSTSYFEENFTDNTALVIGSEGNGISSLVKKKCDVLVNIPMAGKISSLNASVAAGILMYEVFKQRLENRQV